MKILNPLLICISGVIWSLTSSCTPPESAPPEDGVLVDGSPVNEGVELSAGLHDDPFSKPTEEADNSQQESDSNRSENEPQPDLAFKVEAFRLNTRNGPGLKHKIVGSLSKGTLINPKGKPNNGWIEISDGIYCSMKYLKAIPQKETDN